MKDEYRYVFTHLFLNASNPTQGGSVYYLPARMEGNCHMQQTLPGRPPSEYWNILEKLVNWFWSQTDSSPHLTDHYPFPIWSPDRRQSLVPVTGDAKPCGDLCYTWPWLSFCLLMNANNVMCQPISKKPSTASALCTHTHSRHCLFTSCIPNKEELHYTSDMFGSISLSPSLSLTLGLSLNCRLLSFSRGKHLNYGSASDTQTCFLHGTIMLKDHRPKNNHKGMQIACKEE